MCAVAGPRSRFESYFQDLLDGGRPVSALQLPKLRALWDEWVSERPRALPGEILLVKDPPPWRDVLERIEARLGFEPSPEPEPLGEVEPADGRPLERLPPGRSREEILIEARVRLDVALTKKLENGGKPSLRSIHRRLRELGYPVSWRRVRERWQEMKPE